MSTIVANGIYHTVSCHYILATSDFAFLSPMLSNYFYCAQGWLELPPETGKPCLRLYLPPFCNLKFTVAVLYVAHGGSYVIYAVSLPFQT